MKTKHLASIVSLCLFAQLACSTENNSVRSDDQPRAETTGPQDETETEESSTAAELAEPNAEPVVDTGDSTESTPNETDTIIEGQFNQSKFLEYCADSSYTASFKSLALANGIANFNCDELSAAVRKLAMLDLSNGTEVSLAVDVLATLGHIETLDLSGATIANLSFLRQYSHLKTLILADSQLEEFELPALASLQTLNLSGLRISSLPLDDLTSLRPLTQLQHLYLADNAIQDLEPIRDLAKLTVLDLSNNAIETLEYLPKSSTLQRLELTGNQLSDAGVKGLAQRLSGGSIFGSDELTYLDLSRNNLNLANTMGPLSYLKMLDISLNPMTDATALFASDSIRRLKYLNLYTPEVVFPAVRVSQANLSGILLWGDEEQNKADCVFEGNIGMDCFYNQHSE